MLLHHCFNDRSTFQVIASDLNRQVVQIAQQGIYENYSLQKVTDTCASAYFTAQKAGTMQVTGEIRRLVQYQVHNLMEQPKMKSLDLILVRNVLIYFDKKTKDSGYRSLGAKPSSGWLVNPWWG